MKKIIFLLSLLVITAFIWIQLYTAGQLPYDDNYGQLMSAFLLSLIILVIAIIMMIKKSPLVFQNLAISIIFLILNSPPTVCIVVFNYKRIFGVSLAVG